MYVFLFPVIPLFLFSRSCNVMILFVDAFVQRRGTPAVGVGGTSTLMPGSGQQSLVIEIPNDMVGLLIGKAGETIRQLQQRSGANIQVTRDSESDPIAKTRRVTLSGTAYQIQTAQMEIANLVLFVSVRNQLRISVNHELCTSPLQKPGTDQGATSGGGGGGGGGGAQNTTVIKIPNSTVGIVIGRSGESIKMLQNKSGARIQISKEVTGPEREVTLSGAPQAVELAKYEINQLISQVPTAVTHIVTKYWRSIS